MYRQTVKKMKRNIFTGSQNLPTDQNPAFNAEAEVENISTAEAVETKEREEFPKTEDDNNNLLNDESLNKWLEEIGRKNNWLDCGCNSEMYNNRDYIKWSLISRIPQLSSLLANNGEYHSMFVFPAIAESLRICGVFISNDADFSLIARDNNTGLYYTWDFRPDEDPEAFLNDPFRHMNMMSISKIKASSEMRIKDFFSGLR